MSVMHFANALVWEIIGPAIAGPTGPCATPMHVRTYLGIPGSSGLKIHRLVAPLLLRHLTLLITYQQVLRNGAHCVAMRQY